jgi:endo-1,4-beta-xylanase
MVADDDEHGLPRQGLGRREFLLGASAALAVCGTSSKALAGGPPPFAYGASSMIQNFREDPEYRKALLRHCDIITPMNDLKWEQVQRERGRFDFVDADEQITFALDNGKRVRGHALLWHEALPEWFGEVASRKEAERELVAHIEAVVDRYKDKISSWDVVNEVIANDPLEDGVYRQSVWQKLIGAEHIDIAFATAAKVAPNTELVINEYDLENEGPRYAKKREAMLGIVRHLQDRNIRVSAVGFQAHLYAERVIDRDAIARFARDLQALDVHLLVTELDVIDWRLPADKVARDAAASRHVETFLEAVMAEGTLRDVVTWGITDRYSWIAEVFKRDDGLQPRPLPLDENYREKPMMAAIRRLSSSR